MPTATVGSTLKNGRKLENISKPTRAPAAASAADRAAAVLAGPTEKAPAGSAQVVLAPAALDHGKVLVHRRAFPLAKAVLAHRMVLARIVSDPALARRGSIGHCEAKADDRKANDQRIALIAPASDARMIRRDVVPSAVAEALAARVALALVVPMARGDQADPEAPAASAPAARLDRGASGRKPNQARKSKNPLHNP